MPGPLDCFLVHRGLRTLGIRVRAHTDNGRALSEYLAGAPGVYDVRWPGFGGMVSFRHPDARRIASSTQIFSLAESLGGVESLIEVPQSMTHQSVEGIGRSRARGSGAPLVRDRARRRSDRRHRRGDRFAGLDRRRDPQVPVR